MASRPSRVSKDKAIALGDAIALLPTFPLESRQDS